MASSVVFTILPFLILKFAIGDENKAFESLTQCIVKVCARNLSYKPTVLIQYPEKLVINNSELFDMLVNEVNDYGIPNIISENVNIVSNSNVEEKIGDILTIIVVDDCEEIEKIKFENKFSKYILVVLGQIEECKAQLRSAKELITLDVIVAFKVIGEEFSFMNVKFEIDETTCKIIDVVQFVEINTCVNGWFTKPGSFFPHKSLRNFKNCPLNTGIGELYPYMTIRNKEIQYKNLDSIEESDITGSDVEIIKIMASHFNATINYYYIYKDQENPYVDTEFIKLLLNGSLDLCAGGLYRIFGDIVEYSGVYSRQSIVWAYSVERDIRSWESFVAKINGLYYFLIFFTVHVIMWKIICTTDNRAFSLSETLLSTWGALVGSSSLQDAVTLKQKIVNIMYLILSLHFSAYISVQLYSYLTIQSPPHRYRTFDKLMESGTKPYLKLSSKYFINDHKYETFANTSGDCDDFRHCQEVILDKKGTTIVLDGYMPIYQVRTTVNNEARVIQLHEEFLIVYHEMILRKHMYFEDEFRKAMSHLFVVGICRKLYRDAMGILLTDKARVAVKNVLSNSYSCQLGCKITLRQSAGAFYIWIFGCILACLVLAVEILVKKLEIIRQPLEM